MLARAVLMLGLILLPSTGAIIHPPGSLTEMDLTVGDAGTVLYEEITATWCEICSLIDPLLEEVDHRQGSRMHRVALHPVGSDPSGHLLRNIASIASLIAPPTAIPRLRTSSTGTSSEKGVTWSCSPRCNVVSSNERRHEARARTSG